MSSQERAQFNNPVISWVDERLPIFTMMTKEYGVFPTPRNFNYFWNFGAIAMVMLITMIVTGLVLAMSYAANTHIAFESVERIMRDVNYGWLLRYVHANGASMFFIAVYIHIFRGMYYGSYKRPRELLWILGVLIFLLMMGTAFMGYVLPWGQMSFWGATVITNLFSALPLVGGKIVTWLWGGFSVDNPTLNRFFVFHFLLPFVIVGVVFLHIWALHVTGSGNPLGIEPKSKRDTIPFHPYYTTKDGFGILVFLIVYAFFIFFAPNVLGHPDNYIPANPMQTPPHIVPEWYFLPFYAILRAVPDVAIPFTKIVLLEAKLGGVLAMFGAIGIWFVLPWLDRSPIRSAVFRPWYKKSMIALVVAFILLGCAGYNPADANVSLFGHDTGLPWLWVARIAGVFYFAHFIVLIPFFSVKEPRPTLPPSIHEAVLKGKKAAPIVAVLLAVFMMAMPGSAKASSDEIHYPQQKWSFDGPFGTFDRASVQRGYQVYKQVCSACHGLHYLSYRNLVDIGLSELQVKAVAAEVSVTDGPNDDGEMFERPGLPSDRFKSPFLNEKQARAANNGAYPPDLSLIVKARHDGANYIHALLTGYTDAPADVKVGAGMHYNKYFAGHQIAMTPPLVSDDQVAYADGTKATVDQMAYDVANFLTWAAEPKMEARKQMGVKVMIFLFIFAAIMYAVKKKVWRGLEKYED
jgi:ubiquinol-cytochrome c reductase cytochrome b/c1 subunit